MWQHDSPFGQVEHQSDLALSPTPVAELQQESEVVARFLDGFWMVWGKGLKQKLGKISNIYEHLSVSLFIRSLSWAKFSTSILKKTWDNTRQPGDTYKDD